MSTTITINDITGATPFDVYLCDYPTTICVYIDTINSIPYSFDVPPVMESQSNFVLKVIDDNDCEVVIYLDTDNQPCAEYLGYDLYPWSSCWSISPDFIIKLPVVLVNGLPCGCGAPNVTLSGGLKNCPLGTIEYSINGGTPLSFTAATFGGASCGYTLAGCDCTIIKLEGPTEIFLGGYSGQTVTIDYTGTYPSTPPLTFTETFVINVPLTCP